MAKKTKFQKRKTVNGVEHFSCTNCDTFFERTNFTKEKYGFGIKTQCKQCTNKKNNELYHRSREDRNRRERERRRRKIEICRNAQDAYDEYCSNRRISISIPDHVVDSIRNDISSLGISELSKSIGIGEGPLRSLASGRRTSVYKESAIKILDRYFSEEIRSNIFRNVSDFLPDGISWSINHQSCIHCGRIRHQHRSNGICKECFKRIEAGATIKYSEEVWSKYHYRCVSCGETSNKHCGRGLCRPCWRKKTSDGTIESYPRSVSYKDRSAK